MTVRLRPWAPDDARALIDALADDEALLRQVGLDAVPDLAGARHLVGTRLRSDLWSCLRAVEVDGVVRGNVAVNGIERRHDTGWVSYWLAPSARGKGLAVRAVATLAAHAFGELGLFRLELGHRVENAGSCAVATRAGFAVEGLERAKLRYGSERFDVETHARLATDDPPPVEPIPLTH
ncbi:MAG: GNAT family N-acetyltransferase [Actinomycetaceae bacterium]